MQLKFTHVAGAMLIATAVPVAAQNTSTTADPYAGQHQDNDNHDDSGKWGLVGLLGLGGLLGLKRRDRDDHRHTATTPNDRR